MFFTLYSQIPAMSGNGESSQIAPRHQGVSITRPTRAPSSSRMTDPRQARARGSPFAARDSTLARQSAIVKRFVPCALSIESHHVVGSV